MTTANRLRPRGESNKGYAGPGSFGPPTPMQIPVVRPREGQPRGATTSGSKRRGEG
jgi:hypothetical protein